MQTEFFDYKDFIASAASRNFRSWAVTWEDTHGDTHCDVLAWEPRPARFYKHEPYEGRSEVSSYWDMCDGGMVRHVRAV